MPRAIIIISGFLALLCTGCAVQRSTISPATPTFDLQVEKIETDSIFDSSQRLTIVTVSSEASNLLTWNLGYSQEILQKTSDFAWENNALAAINAGFFDMKDGGSVTYLEVGDKVIANARPNKTLNGALVISAYNQVEIMPDRGETFYSTSDREKAVLVTGPILIQNGLTEDLADTKFVMDRHPRSCVCVTVDRDVLLIAVDGRRPKAAGMSLVELQEFLQGIECHDAINLDGGGSTTLWVKGRGVLNNPSDLFGERRVANVLFIRRK